MPLPPPIKKKKTNTDSGRVTVLADSTKSTIVGRHYDRNASPQGITIVPLTYDETKQRYRTLEIKDSAVNRSIPKSDFELASRCPLVRSRIKSGEWIVIDQKDDRTTDPLASYSERDAIEVIRAERDRETLHFWRRSSRNHRLIEEIDTRERQLKSGVY